jgi:hypothetical protein
MDQALAKMKIFSAIAELTDTMASDEVLRPSAAGQCPPRLWYRQAAIKDEAYAPERNPENSWAALQGNLTEVLLRDLLERAGAEILHPPEDWGTSRDEQTGQIPHADGAIRWPDVGLDDWHFLETKFLRAMAAVEIILNGVEEERIYKFQAANYLHLGELIVANAGWDIPVPKRMCFMLAPKDPSTARMFVNQRINLNKGEREYEADNTKKSRTFSFEKYQRKLDWQARVEVIGPLSFYFEVLDKQDPEVLGAWDDTIKLMHELKTPWPPEPLHDPHAPEDMQDAECKWYCEFADRCRADILKRNLKRSVQ